MPSERAQIARRGLALFESRDFDAGLELLCPDAEWDVSEILGGGVYCGHSEIRAHWEMITTEVWERIQMDVERLTEQGDQVVAHVRFRGTGAGSGVEIDVPVVWVATFRGNRFSRVKLSLAADAGVA